MYSINRVARDSHEPREATPRRLDGHADFYQPEAEPNGEAASMDLALATGRGPAIVADLDGGGRLVRDKDVVHLGRRDAEEAEATGMGWDELETVPRTAVAGGRVRGLEVTIFDPALAPDASIAAALVVSLVAGLQS